MRRSSPLPITQAHPVVTRPRLADSTSTKLAMTRPHDGLSSTPRRANRLPMVMQMLQARSSLKTYGVAAKSMKTEPPMMVAISRPYEVASALPIATSPRIRMRTRHSSSDANRPVSSQATSMNGAVSLPSRLWVTARIGIRISVGKRLK